MNKRESGFSLMELVIVMGVLSVVAAITAQYFGENLKYILLGEQKSNRLTDISHGKNFLYKDLRNSSPSFQFFNTLATVYRREEPPKDCEEITGIEGVFWHVSEKEMCQGYEVELKEVGDEFTFLKSSIGSEVDAIIFSPSLAYKFLENGTASFKKSKFEAALNDARLGGQNLLKIQAANNIEDAEGEMTNFAAIYNLKEDKLDSTDHYNILDLQCSLANIVNIDQYFRCLPPVGLKKVKISPVSLVSYTLKEEIKATSTERYIERSTTNDGTSFTRVRMFPNILSLRFFRETTTTAQISFEMDIPRAQTRRKETKTETETP